MINSFKRVIRHILWYTLNYTPVVGWVVQEAYNREVLKKSCSLEFIPDMFKTQGMCDEAVRREPYSLRHAPDCLKNEKMCIEAVKNKLSMMFFIPDHLMTEEMCNTIVSIEIMTGVMIGTKAIKNVRPRKPQ